MMTIRISLPNQLQEGVVSSLPLASVAQPPFVPMPQCPRQCPYHAGHSVSLQHSCATCATCFVSENLLQMLSFQRLLRLQCTVACLHVHALNHEECPQWD